MCLLLYSKECVRLGLMRGCECVLEGVKVHVDEKLPSAVRLGEPICLQYLPEGLLLRSRDAEWTLPESQLPPLPDTFDRRGLFVLTPETAYLRLNVGNNNFHVRRTQFAVVPASARVSYGAQGEQWDAVVGDLRRPPRMSSDLLWLSNYVIISRARSLEGLLFTRLCEKEELEQGAPRYLVEEVERLLQLERHSTIALLGYLKETKVTLPPDILRLFDPLALEAEPAWSGKAAHSDKQSSLSACRGFLATSSTPSICVAAKRVRLTGKQTLRAQSVDTLTGIRASAVTSNISHTAKLQKDLVVNAVQSAVDLKRPHSPDKPDVSSVRRLRLPTPTTKIKCATNDPPETAPSILMSKEPPADPHGQDDAALFEELFGSPSPSSASSEKPTTERTPEDALPKFIVLPPQTPCESTIDTSMPPCYRMTDIRDDREDGALCGLNNIGNTCWGNALIQVLARVKLVRLWLCQHLSSVQHGARIDDHVARHDSHCPSCLLGKDLHRLTSALENKPFDPDIILERTRWEVEFRGCGQQDAHEAFCKLLTSCDAVDQTVLERRLRDRGLPQDVYDETLAKSMLDNPFWQIFGGSEKTTVHCASCSYASESLASFHNILLPMPRLSGSSIEQAVAEYLEVGVLDDHCLELGCPGVRGCRRSTLSIERWPSCLVLALKRFEQTLDGRRRKLSRHVSFGPTLMVAGGAEYALRGLVVHSGGFGAGHYTAYVRVSGLTWYLFDDACAPRVVPFADVACAEAYILFYDLVTSEETSVEEPKEDGAIKEQVVVEEERSTIHFVAGEPALSLPSSVAPLASSRGEETAVSCKESSSECEAEDVQDARPSSPSPGKATQSQSPRWKRGVLRAVGLVSGCHDEILEGGAIDNDEAGITSDGGGGGDDGEAGDDGGGPVRETVEELEGDGGKDELVDDEDAEHAVDVRCDDVVDARSAEGVQAAPPRILVRDDYLRAQPTLEICFLLGYDLLLPGSVEVNHTMCGLINIGNTCWGNSLLQVFAKIQPLRVWLRQHETIHHDEHCCLCYLAGDLRRLSTSVVNEPFAPRCMLNRAQWNAAYDDMRQQDANEACISLLRACDNVDQDVLSLLSNDVEELRTASAKHATPFCMIFSGRQRTDTHCTACSTTRQVFEVFSMLQVPIPDEERPSVESALARYIGLDRLASDDKCQFLKTDRAPCGAIGCRSTQTSVEWWPTVLTIGIKRFDNRLQKISKPVSLQLTLAATSGITYDLRGVVVHHGESLNAGHYGVYVCGLASKWFYCSDELQPRHVPVAEVLSAQAYLLFYEKR